MLLLLFSFTLKVRFKDSCDWKKRGMFLFFSEKRGQNHISTKHTGYKFFVAPKTAVSRETTYKLTKLATKDFTQPELSRRLLCMV